MGLPGEFERCADWAAAVSPLYERIARCVADDPDLLAIAAEAPENQPAPQLLLGAVHALLLGGNDHPLANFYPTCTEDPVDGDPFFDFREFCLANADVIRDTVASRRVQTNEVGRSVVFVPAFEHVARSADRSFVLIEIGASAGDFLVEFSMDRPIHWLSDDPSSELDYPTYRHVVLSDGMARETRLAEYKSYGEWVRWLTDSGE